MLEPDDLELRKKLITATDARAIMGVCPHRTVHDVYLEKMGLAPEPTDEQRRRFRLGHLLEDVLMRYASEETGLVFKPVKTLVHPSLDWVGATPDRMVFKSEDDAVPFACAEGKSVGFWMAKDWNSETLPNYVHVQTQWQMTATKTKENFVCALVAGEPHLLHVEHSDSLESALLENCERFYKKHILGHVPPAPDGSDHAERMLRALYPESRVELVSASPENEAMVLAYLQARQEAEAAESRAVLLKQAVQMLLADSQGLKGDGWQITYRNDSRGRPDWKAIATEALAKLGPSDAYLQELLAKHTPIPGPRKFCVTDKRKKQAAKEAA